MKKPYYKIIVLFILITFSSVLSANYDQDKYISYFKNKLTRISNLSLKPINIKVGFEQVIFIEVTKNGNLFRSDSEKTIKNKELSKSINRLLILAAPYRRFPDTFDKNIKLAKIKITFSINDTKKIFVKNIKIVEFKNVIPKKL